MNADQRGNAAWNETLWTLLAADVIYATVTEQSIARLFIAGVVPGIMLALLFMGYIFFRAVLQVVLGGSLVLAAGVLIGNA